MKRQTIFAWIFIVMSVYLVGCGASPEQKLALVGTWQKIDNEDLIVEFTSGGNAIISNGTDVNSTTYSFDGYGAMARAAVDWDDKKKLAAKQQAQSKQETDSLSAGPLPTITIRGKTIFLGQRVRFPDAPFKLDRKAILSGDSGTITAIDLDLQTYEVQIDGSDKKVTLHVDDSLEIKNNYALWYMVANRIRQRRELEHARTINTPAPSTGKAPDFFQWNPAQPSSPTIFTDLSQASFGGLSSFSSANTQIYQETDTIQQHAAAWHEQVKQANQTTHWSKQQAEYVQELGHTHEQTTSTHEHRL